MIELSLYGFYIIGHIFGVILGMGGAFVGDAAFLTTIRKARITATELRFIKLCSHFAVGGLIITFIFGLLIFALDPAGYLDSAKFLAKMSIVAILTLNGIFFHVVHIPRLTRTADTDLTASPEFRAGWVSLLVSGGISAPSWLCAFFLGSVSAVNTSYWWIMAAYLVIVAISICGSLVVGSRIIPLSLSQNK